VGLAHLARAALGKRQAPRWEEVRRRIPVRLAEGELEGGRLTLRIPLSEQPSRIAKMLSRREPAAAKVIELDEVGTFVWEQIDGKRSIEAISSALQARHKLHRAEAEASLIAFFELLLQRRLATLKPLKEKPAKRRK
jgi:hypothetical protein